MGALIANHIFDLSLLAFLLVCSGFFSGSETALFSLSRERLRGYEQRRARWSDCVLALLRAPRLLLATVLLGNMVVNVLFYSVSFGLAHDASKVSPWAGGAVGVFSLLVVIVFGEVGPKGLAVAHPERFARWVAAPLYVIEQVLRPPARGLVRLIRGVTERVGSLAESDPYVNEDELKMLVEMAQSQQALDGRKSAMIQYVVDLGRTRVKQIMVPRVDMETFRIGDGRERFLDLVRRSHHKRYLCYRRRADDIAMALFTRDALLAPRSDLRNLLRPVVFVPETKTVESLLRMFREQGIDFAVVVDEYGGTAGMVTMEDVIEEIVGEIEDEGSAASPDVTESGENTYLLPGGLSLSAWREMFGQDLPSANVDTVGGLVTALLGRMPEVGDTVRFRNLEFRVCEMRKWRIVKVQLRLTPDGDAEEAAR